MCIRDRHTSASRSEKPVARGIRRSAGPLDHRAQAILRVVIEDYITSAAPVGSQTLVDRYRLQVSSATVRTILAELEMEGLLSHPHLSLIHISEPTRLGMISYAVFCLKKKK